VAKLAATRVALARRGRSRLESKRRISKRVKEMEKRTRRKLALFGVVSVALVTAGKTTPASQTTAAPGWAQVDCPKEDAGAVQRAVDRARPGDTILVSGTCHENVLIPEGTNRITLNGGGSASIVGADVTRNTISIRGQGTIVTGFTVTGGRTGIDVVRGGTALIDGNTIEGTGQFGITVGSWGAANIVNNTIQNNPGHGISVIGNSFAFIGFRTAIDTVASPNVIRNNGLHGISVTLSSSARIVGNTISGNTRNGITVDRASQTNISDNTIDGNGQNGIFVSENAGVNLGSDTGSGIFDMPNRTIVNNGLRGITCRVGGYANGRLGTLNGNSGPKDLGASCLDSLDTPDTF
jgi:parallel beta-helix repeat protein